MAYLVRLRAGAVERIADRGFAQLYALAAVHQVFVGKGLLFFEPFLSETEVPFGYFSILEDRKKPVYLEGGFSENLGRKLADLLLFDPVLRDCSPDVNDVRHGLFRLAGAGRPSRPLLFC